MKFHKHQLTYMYGKNPVREALLHAPQCIGRIYLSPNIDDPDFVLRIRSCGISITELTSRDIEKMLPDGAVHQGVVATIDPSKIMIDMGTLLQRVDIEQNPSLVLLDELQDPQNVGAIIRSAVAFGAGGVLIPEHNQASVTGAVVKASAGMAFRIPLVSIGNINTAIRDLKEVGFWSYGLAMHGDRSLNTEVFDAPALFVVGSEGTGIRQKTLETCDFVLRIPIDERVESLNASVAAAITLYQWYVNQ